MIKLFNCYNSAGYFDTNLLVKEIPKTENEKKVNKPITSRKQNKNHGLTRQQQTVYTALFDLLIVLFKLAAQVAGQAIAQAAVQAASVNVSTPVLSVNGLHLSGIGGGFLF